MKSLVVYLIINLIGNYGYSQNCSYLGSLDTEYYTVDYDGNKIVKKNLFLRLCDSFRLNYTLDTSDFIYQDPVPGTPSSIRLFFMNRMPADSILSLEAFKNALLPSGAGGRLPVWDKNERNGGLKYFTTPGTFETYIIPVVVDNSQATTLEGLFEKDCIRLYPSQGLRYIEPYLGRDYREEIKFGLFQFDQWPGDISFLDYLDLYITDEQGNAVNYKPYDNNTIWMDMKRRDAFFDMNFYVKGSHSCTTYHIGNFPYPFPTVDIQIGSVYGRKDEEICIPVTSRYFTSITDFSFPFYWHADSLQFMRLANIHPQLRKNYQIFVGQKGKFQLVRITPTRDFSDTLTIPNDEVLFELCVVPQINGSGKIPVKMTHQDSLDFKINDVPVLSRSHDGAVYLLEEGQFYVEWTPVCSRNSPGLYSIKLKIFGDEGPYTYSFNPGNIPDSTFRDSIIVIDNIPAGTYEMTIRNDSGISVSKDITITPDMYSAPFTVQVDSAHIVYPGCGTTNTGEIPLILEPPSDTYHYRWIEGGIDYDSPVIMGLNEGKVTIRITDENQCSTDIEYEFKNQNSIQVSWNEEDLYICPEDTTVEVPLNVSLSEYRLSIDAGDTLISPGTIHLPKGIHSLAFRTSDCRLDTIIQVEQVSPAEIIPSLPEQIDLDTGDSLILNANINPAPTDITWTFHNKIIGKNQNLKSKVDSSEMLYLSIKYGPGCTTHDSVFIVVIPEEEVDYEVSLPNSFSPNGDGYNDVFSIPNNLILSKIQNLEIYDRYGALVYQWHEDSGNDSRPQWDGMISGVPAATGIYVAKAHLTDHDPKVYIWTIHLLR